MPLIKNKINQIVKYKNLTSPNKNIQKMYNHQTKFVYRFEISQR